MLIYIGAFVLSAEFIILDLRLFCFGWFVWILVKSCHSIIVL